MLTFILGSQGVFVDGASIYTGSNTLLYTQGDVELTNGAGIQNEGQIELTRNWINNSGSEGLINDGSGSVSFIGGNQFISGGNITHFNDVNLFGGVSLKEIFQSVIVKGNLNIADAELQIHQNIFHLTNQSPSSLIWNNGFVSGDSIGGYFARSTNSIEIYRFPVGNVNLFNSQYRAIDITPVNTDSNVYGVRLAVEDASLDNTGTSFSGATGPYDRLTKQNSLLEINPVFYHHISRIYGLTPVNIKLYYFNSDHLSSDRKLDGLSQWKSNVPRWEFQSTLFEPNIFGPNNIGRPNNSVSWLSNSFNDDAFALTVMNGMLAFVPQIFSPNGDGTNDIIYVRGRKIKALTFIIYNRWGEKVFESNDKDFGWNGLYKGSDAQSGVYVYYLDAEIEDYGEFKQKGNITLVR